MLTNTIAKKKSVHGMPSISGSVPKLLVVDDDPIYCRLISAAAAKAGLQTHLIASVRTAYRNVETIDFDIALIDYDLGAVTGVQLSRFIQRVRPNKTLVLVSAYRSIRNIAEQADCIKALLSKKLPAEEQVARLCDIWTGLTRSGI